MTTVGCLRQKNSRIASSFGAMVRAGMGAAPCRWYFNFEMEYLKLCLQAVDYGQWYKSSEVSKEIW